MTQIRVGLEGGDVTQLKIHQQEQWHRLIPRIRRGGMTQTRGGVEGGESDSTGDPPGTMAPPHP
jgi:hypothetical protein